MRKSEGLRNRSLNPSPTTIRPSTYCDAPITTHSSPTDSSHIIASHNICFHISSIICVYDDQRPPDQGTSSDHTGCIYVGRHEGHMEIIPALSNPDITLAHTELVGTVYDGMSDEVRIWAMCLEIRASGARDWSQGVIRIWICVYFISLGI
jgi:hypothetical protein